MTLTEFISEKLAVALDYRGLSKLNPVEFVIEGNAQKFVVLVSLLEPNTLSVPYNVLWINADPEHEDYGVLMRRVDAEKYDDKNYRGTWSVLSTYDEMFTEGQYFKHDADPILGEVEQFLPPLSSHLRIGGFTLTNVREPDEDEDETVEDVTIAVGTNDPRMSDKRVPKPHSHVQTPLTMFSTGDGTDNFVSVSTINDPVAGDVLFIKEVLENGNAIGYWAPLTTEFAYAGPRPVAIHTTGPTVKVRGNTNHVLRADVDLDDGTKLYSVKATWTVVANGEFGTVNANTGVFHANPVPEDTPVTVRVSWTHPDSGDTVTQDYIIVIIGDPSIIVLESIAIQGPTSFQKTTTGQYTVVAKFSNGSQQTVTPNVFSSSNTDAGSFTGGLLTPRSTQVRNVTTKLSATYVRDGVTRSATLDVTIIDPVVYPETITIVGANSVNQNSTSQYKAHVVFSDGTEQDVTGTWSVEATTYATVNATGLLTAKELTTEGSKSTTLKVSFTSNTVTLTASKVVQIADNKNWPVSAVITGLASLAPNEFAQYVYTVTYKNGTTADKTPTWATSNQTLATVDAAGLLTAKANGSVNLTATYSEQGKSLNATKAITIATASVTIPPLRYGTAMFSNVNFTGGPIASEITQEERDYGVTAETSPSGKQYTHWTGLADFVTKVMTKTLALQPGESPKTIETTINVDDYIYIMWDARAGDIYLVDLANNFNVTFDGICYRNDVLGNEDGLPGYNPNLPKVLTVQFNDGTGVRPWKIVRGEATTVPAAAPRTDQHSIKYV